MDKKVIELIEATGVWVGVCMKQYPDSRFVDDKLVRVCAALSAFKDNDKTPLPCPFCGAAPALIHKPEGPRDACSKIACVNMHCPVQPEICDDRRVAGVDDPKACKAVLISLWNKRAKC